MTKQEHLFFSLHQAEKFSKGIEDDGGVAWITPEYGPEQGAYSGNKFQGYRVYYVRPVEEPVMTRVGMLRYRGKFYIESPMQEFLTRAHSVDL
jgi:hypothetical protein